jgi:hemerythrin-like domain-containing protein
MIQIGAPAATIAEPIEHLLACHRRIEQRLETLVKAADHVAENREEALAAISRSLQFLDTSGELHTEDEEASLFPRLRPKLSAVEIAFVDSLEAQHTQAEAIYSRLKGLVGGQEIGRYRECAEELRALYREHIRAEDEVLMALARRSLDEAEISEISGEMQARRGR